MNQPFTDNHSSLVIGVLINGEGLDSPLVLPRNLLINKSAVIDIKPFFIVRPREQNTPQLILNEIEKLAQSDKKIPLINNPMTITVTTAAKPEGGARPKHLLGHYGFNRNSLIEVINPENKYCLFIAAELARLRCSGLETNKKTKTSLAKTSTENPTYKLFRVISTSVTRQQQLAEELMEKCKIPLDFPSYNTDHLEIVQRYYNKTYGHLFQISVFNDDPFTTKNIHPIWKGKCERISENDEIKNIFLFLEKEHFSVITCLGSLFRVPKKKYCICNFI
jgi:hypothetical protein